MCCSPWGHKESDTTERLNRTELNGGIYYKYIHTYFIYIFYTYIHMYIYKEKYLKQTSGIIKKKKLVLCFQYFPIFNPEQFINLS